MIDGRENGARGGVVETDFQADRPLANGGQDIERGNLERAGLALEKALGDRVPEPLQAGAGQDDGVQGAGGELLKAGGHVASKLDAPDAGAKPLELARAADAAGADSGTLGQRGQRGVGTRDQQVRGIRTGEHRREAQPGRVDPGQILEAVHGGVDGAVEERLLDFLGEKALQAGGAFFPGFGILPAIARSGDDLHFDGEIGLDPQEGLLDDLDLCEGEGAAPGAKNEPGHHEAWAPMAAEFCARMAAGFRLPPLASQPENSPT